MTFSLIGFCNRTQKIGYVISTSSPAVGQRCCDIVPGYGVFTYQAFVDSRLRAAARKLMELGLSPSKVLKDVGDCDERFAYRQIAILDLYGRSAIHTGESAIKWSGHVAGADHVAIGNVLAGEQVVTEMSRAFIEASDEELEERLMRAIEAGRDAGGQPDGQVSAAIVVAGGEETPPMSEPFLNLRIDVSLEPIGELRKIFDWYLPLVPYYKQWIKDPSSVGRYKDFLRGRELPINPYL